MVSISLPLCILMVHIWTLWMLPFPLVVSEVSGAPRLWLGPPTRGPEANSPQRPGGEWISGEGVWQLPRSAVDSQRYKWILCQMWGRPSPGQGAWPSGSEGAAAQAEQRPRGGKEQPLEGPCFPKLQPGPRRAVEGCPTPPSLCKTSPPPSLTPASCFEAAT